MKFAILVYEPEAEMSARTDPNRAMAYWGAYSAYSKEMATEGVAAGGTALQPPALATTVRIRDKQIVQDGPYADTKEQLGGLFIIDVPDIDHAIQWAAKCPAATKGVLEVRPVLEMNA